MCYESLIDGDAAERPLTEVLRGELSSAVTDGAVAAAVVLAVLLANGVVPLLVAGATVGAFVLGIALHQAVLVAGIAVLRWRAPEPGSEPEIDASTAEAT